MSRWRQTAVGWCMGSEANLGLNEGNTGLHSVIIWLQNTCHAAKLFGVICWSLCALLELKKHVQVHFGSVRVAPAELMWTLTLDFKIYLRLGTKGQYVNFTGFFLTLTMDKTQKRCNFLTYRHHLPMVYNQIDFEAGIFGFNWCIMLL